MSSFIANGNAVEALVAAFKGMPISIAARAKGLEVRQLVRTISRDDRLSQLVEFCHNGGAEKFSQHVDVLNEIAQNPDTAKRMCKMDEGFLEWQYDNILAGNAYGFCDGTWSHPDNVDFVAYLALTKDPEHPLPASEFWDEARDGIKGLPRALHAYFRKRLLGGVFGRLNPRKVKKNTTLHLLLVYDNVWVKKHDQPSLYHKSEPGHLHEWGDGRYPTKGYLRERENGKRMVTHCFTEHNKMFGFPNRDAVMDAIDDISETDLSIFLERIGLESLLDPRIPYLQGSPLAVFELYDETWREAYKKLGVEVPSIFDLSQERHFHKWAGRFKAPNKYWEEHPEESDQAVYHVLCEANPKLASNDRDEVIAGIRELPSQISAYLYDTLPTTLVRKGFKNESVRTVLGAFDRWFRVETNNTSLFYEGENDYLRFNSRGELIRTKDD